MKPSSGEASSKGLIPRLHQYVEQSLHEMQISSSKVACLKDFDEELP